MRPGNLIMVIVFVMFCDLSYSQSFIKITEGVFVNDGGWSYAMCWAILITTGTRIYSLLITIPAMKII